MVTWIRKYLPYFAALLGIFVIPYVLINTPSFSESSLRFSMMKDDLRQLVVDESSVISRREVNKYGVASLSIEVAGRSVGDDDVEKLGWKPVPGRKHTFCKDGMIYVMSLSKKVYLGMKVLRISFRYTSKTIEICQVKPDKI